MKYLLILVAIEANMFIISFKSANSLEVDLTIIPFKFAFFPAIIYLLLCNRPNIRELNFSPFLPKEMI